MKRKEASFLWEEGGITLRKETLLPMVGTGTMWHREPSCHGGNRNNVAHTALPAPVGVERGEVGGRVPTIAPGWVGCTNSSSHGWVIPAPGIHQHATGVALARCHCHGGILVREDEALGSCLGETRG